MLGKLCLIGALVVGSLILPLQADAGRDVPRTNAGGKYVHYGRTNAGGKYVYRGIGTKFHTNPGGKYVYGGRGGSPGAFLAPPGEDVGDAEHSTSTQAECKRDPGDAVNN
jgi:hypothetical protein